MVSVQKFVKKFFVTALVIDTIHLYNFIPLPMTLVKGTRSVESRAYLFHLLAQLSTDGDEI